MNYTEIENEIIEDAYNEKSSRVEIDGGHTIDLKQWTQHQKDDPNRQRQVKRVQLGRDRSNVHLRDDRFALSVTVSSTALNTGILENNSDFARGYFMGDFPLAYYNIEIRNTKKTLNDVIEEAAQGIITQGTTLGKLNEAH